jgi:ubiquitin-protein ligase E3 C
VLTASHRDTADSSDIHEQTYLQTLSAIVKIRPQSIQAVLKHYYNALGRHCRRDNNDNHQRDRLLLDAVIAPLLIPCSGTSTTLLGSSTRRISSTIIGIAQLKLNPEQYLDQAYRDFAISYLSQPDLVVLEKNTDLVSKKISIARLSTALITIFSDNTSVVNKPEDRLWLLAHFISLQNTENRETLNSLYLKALYVQLSTLSSEIGPFYTGEASRMLRKAPSALKHAMTSGYVEEKLKSLVDKHGVSDLLQSFTS